MRYVRGDSGGWPHRPPRLTFRKPSRAGVGPRHEGAKCWGGVADNCLQKMVTPIPPRLFAPAPWQQLGGWGAAPLPRYTAGTVSLFRQLAAIKKHRRRTALLHLRSLNRY